MSDQRNVVIVNKVSDAHSLAEKLNCSSNYEHAHRFSDKKGILYKDDEVMFYVYSLRQLGDVHG